MGANKRRKETFFRDHPYCCFCGGEEKATTIDHIPARVCFEGRVGPEGYEFPACDSCNDRTRQIEQAAALYLRLADQSDREPAVDELEKLIDGVRNNTPHLMPKTTLTANEKRRALRSHNYPIGRDEFPHEAAVVEIPEAFRFAFEVFARKLACALYYKETGDILPLTHIIGTEWFNFTNKKAPELVEKISGMLRLTSIPKRRNTNIGHQFMYVWDRNKEEKLFSFLVQFGKSYFVFGGTASGVRELKPTSRWKLHAADVEPLAARKSGSE